MVKGLIVEVNNHLGDLYHGWGLGTRAINNYCYYYKCLLLHNLLVLTTIIIRNISLKSKNTFYFPLIIDKLTYFY